MIENTVLFVDDQEEILYLIKRMLKEEPYKVLFASNGDEALDLIKNNQVDVVVTDVLMPNMSGLELLEIIKETHPNIVRIILSGFSQIPTLLSAINQGKIYRYITKPWQVDEEAKEVIRDAIKYANLLKADQTNAIESITIDQVHHFLVGLGVVFVITLEDKIFSTHEKLQGTVEVNENLDLKAIEAFGKLESYELTETIKIYLLQ